LIVNVKDPQYDRWVDREQAPCFYTDDGTAVFEVWFWHCLLQRWFCMSTVWPPEQVAAGVVFFWPGDIAGLRRTMLGLEAQAGFVPRTGSGGR
jgi:hypothetical protein